jgi:hypothetical protein
MSINDPNTPIGFDVEKITSLIATVFSTIVLTAVGVIISGKLMANRIPINLSDDDHFMINLYILKLRSTDDQVIWGFTMFIFGIGAVIIFGGHDAYEYFKLNSGVDLGQWKSLCAIASFLSIFVSSLIWAIAPFLKGTPILNIKERDTQLAKILCDGQSDGESE